MAAPTIRSHRYGQGTGKPIVASADPFGSTRAAIKRGTGGSTKRRKARPKKR